MAENVPLAPLTTLRVGPVARRVITCDTTDQVVATLRALDSEPGPVLVMAGGSNVVIADDLTDLTVVRLATTGVTVDGATLRVEAGAVWDVVVAESPRHGVWVGWSACPGFPGRQAPRRCRTSAPTASRSPTPSRGCGCWTAAAARCAGCRPRSWASATVAVC